MGVHVSVPVHVCVFLHSLTLSHNPLTPKRCALVAQGGVLIVGYEMLRRLAREEGSVAKKLKQRPETIPKDVEEFSEVQQQLLNPGPDLVVCDEGHRIKNEKAAISQVRRTRRKGGGRETETETETETERRGGKERSIHQSARFFFPARDLFSSQTIGCHVLVLRRC